MIKPIPEELQGSRGWQLVLNGEEVKEVKSLVLSHPKFGVLSYGLTPAGYDDWGFDEVGGGGSVTIPFIRGGEEEDIFIGLLREERWTQGGYAWNVPRGFLNPEEQHFETAIREAQEEVGFTRLASRLFLLPGHPGNPNSAFFITGRDRGVHYFAFEVYHAEVQGLNLVNPEEEILYGEGARYKFRSDLVTGISPVGKKIVGCLFFSIDKAVGIADQFTEVAASRLRQFLLSK